MKQTIICLLSVLLLVGCGKNYSTGSRAGVVTKLSNKGMVFDSWEGELLMTTPPESGIIQPEKFRFSISVSDTVTVEKVKAALKSGKRVELVYRQWWLGPPTIDSEYVVTDVH